ncbi:TolB family protein [Paraburkholderia megapolitana]|uniref:TolB family protein n=1 Tax=Paraburkholderia megapolitana TaxID=420953 RepID=UPI0038BDA13E
MGSPHFRVVQFLLAAAIAMTLAAVLAACGSSLSGGPPPGSADTFAFQPVNIQRINLPGAITSARWPVFANDGQHLLFFSASELWITDLAGADAHCLSCGLVNDPRSPGEGEVTPFPDGKRVFFGGFVQPGSSTMAVLECSPSVVDCASASILPVDFSNAQPKVIPPGGALSTPQANFGGAYAAKLSQDGVHVGFSDIRSDSFENMIVATLQQSAGRYIVTDPRVINPPAPTSVADTDVEHWSNGSALFEFKTFTNGGADATYVESGGPSLLNPDVWSINLATGQRTRITSNPDWDEDNAVSPDGKLLALWSNRTMHYVDWLAGLLPVRDFIDAPASTMTAAAIGSNKECHGPMWLLPSSGDQGGTIAGQPIVYYRDPGVHVTNNLVGWSQWSPDGTMLALNTINDSTGTSAPYLLVAHFTAAQPTTPLPTVSSQPGSWASAPGEYHGALGFDGTITLPGPGGGKVTVMYGGLPGEGALAGQWSETYAGYSEDGRSFINGTVTIKGSAAAGSYSSHLTMTGAHTGSDDAELILKSGGPGGQAHSTYDGNTVTGPTPEEIKGGGCPDMLPKEPALQVTSTDLGNGAYTVKVTVSIAGVGANEATIDTRPVNHATLVLGNATTYTNNEGVATVFLNGSHDLTVTAGDTLVPTSAYPP